MSLLKVEGLAKSFGGVKAVDGVSFEVAPGELLALIGPNGAGKSSMVNCCTGLYRATTGAVSKFSTGVPRSRWDRHSC